MTGGNVAQIYAGNFFGSQTVNANVVITGGTVGYIDLDGNGSGYSGGTSSGIILIDIPTVSYSECFTGVYHSNGTWYVCGDAEIPSGYEVVIESGETMTVDSGETLTNNGTIVNNGTVTVNGTLNTNGSLTNNGAVTVDGTLNTNGSLTNSGTITVDGTLNTEGSFNNSGTINVNGTLNNDESVTNVGTVTVNGILNNRGSINGSGSIYLNAPLGDGEDKIDGNNIIRNALCIEAPTSGTPSVYVNGTEITDFITEYRDGKLYIYPKYTGNIKATLNGTDYYGIIENETGSSELSSDYISVTDIGFSLTEMSFGQVVDLAEYVTLTPATTTYETAITYEVVGATAQYSLNGSMLTAASAGTIELKITAKDTFSEFSKNFTVTIAKADAIDIEAGSVTVSKAETDGKLTVTWAGFDGGSKEYDVTESIVITSGSGTNQGTIIVQDGVTANIVLNGVNITTSSTSPFHVQGTAVVHLTLLGDNVLNASGVSDEYASAAGIRVESGTSLTIDGTGTLTARGGKYAAGIGGGMNGNSGIIIINGGTVTANGGDRGAGIGGGYYGRGNITINGGTVTANGGERGAGIGGGLGGSVNITINGGSVTANGGYMASGIGGGSQAHGGNVTINGGTVTAVGNGGGAGIGGGYVGDGGTITINGGTVTATGKSDGAGIGGGYDGNGGTVVITGGTVKAKGTSAAAIGAGFSGTDAGTLTNGTDPVSLVTVTLNGAASNTEVSAVTSVTYGLNDVKTLDTDKLYFYLPSGADISAITAGGEEYVCNRNLTYYKEHQFQCESAKNCSLCDYIGGEHHFVDGTCTTCGLPEDGEYRISTPEQLLNFAALVNGGITDLNAILMADIDLSEYGNVMIGTSSAKYSGTFDGNGKKLTIKFSTSDHYTALFRYINSATIQNLTVDGTITTNRRYAAGLVSFSEGNSRIEKCMVAVTINSRIYDDVTHGGLVAVVESGSMTINNCGFIGSITGDASRSCGGFVGWAGSTTTISNSYVSGTFTTSTDGCYTFGRNPDNITVTNSYYKTTYGTDNLGAMQKSADQFAFGEVTYLLNTSNSDGDLIWYQTIGTDAVPKFTGGTVYKVTCGGEAYYSNENQSYDAHNFVDGICSYCGGATPAVENNGIYEISNVGQYIWFAKFVNAGNTAVNAKLLADIDLSGHGNVMIGTSSAKYSGTFNGNGKKLTVNFSTTEEEYIAPFRYINGATIQNLTVDGTISTNRKFAAGLVGSSEGDSRIEKCMSAVTIHSSKSGDGTHGGLVAVVQSNSTMTINYCGFIGAITGDATHSCGGLVGWASSTTTISNSYVSGTFTTNTDGCCTFGRNPGNITVSNSYYKTAYGNDNSGATMKSAEQFASGEVTYLLNGSTSEGSLAWGQTIGTDDYPIFGGATAYSYTTCIGGTDYANVQFADGSHIDEYTASGNVISCHCLACGTNLGTATLSGGTYNGSGCEVTVADATGVLAAKEIIFTHDGPAPVDAGTYTVTVTIDGTSFDAQFTISPKAITLIGVEVNYKYYDGTPYVEIDTAAGYDGFKTDGISGYDDITIHYTSAELASADAGTYKQVTVKGLTISGEDAHNYTIVSEATLPVYNIWNNYESSVTVYQKYLTIDLFDQEAGSIDTIDQTKWEIDEYSALLEGHRIETWRLVAEMNEGSAKYGSISLADLKIVDADGNDMTANYSVTAYDATLTITCPDHDEFEEGFCKNCGGYKSAVDSDGDGYYEIENAGQLFWFAEYIANVRNDANAKLMDDITIPDGKEWTPIDNMYGTFDGNHKTISGLYVDSTADYAGLFGYTSWLMIKNLHITDSYFCGTGNVGALVGYLEGEITGCSVSSTVTIKGDGYVGGLAGSTSSWNTITNCYSHAALEGDRTGGLVGYSSAAISNSYSTAGSLVYGMNQSYGGSFENCYYLGSEDDGCDGTTAMTAEQFASGEVAYRLQSGVTGEDIFDEEGNFIETVIPEIWGQNIGTDAYPVLGGMKVYFDENADPKYYNEKSETVSVTVVWTDMSFTYNKGTWNTETLTWDGGGWVAEEGCGTVTVENTGTVDVIAEISYSIDINYSEITVSLSESKFNLAAKTSKTVTVELLGEPKEYIETETVIGSITIILSTVEQTE